MDEKLTAIQIEYLKAIGLDDEGIYESIHDYEDWDWKEFAEYLESALQSAREENEKLKEEWVLLDAMAAKYFKQRNTLKSEADRMREERDIIQSMFSKVADCVIKRFQENSIMGIRQDVMRICTEAEERLKTPAAPEKAETCSCAHKRCSDGCVSNGVCRHCGKPIAEGGEG